MRASGLLGALLLMLALVAPPALAIEDKCGACKTVAIELQERLDKEGVRNHLDMRHRLDPKGQRQGKMIPYKKSEQRITELLDGICNDVKNYGLSYPANDEGSPQWVRVDNRPEGEKRPLGVAFDKPKRQSEQMDIKGYCGTLIERTEDDLAEAIWEDEASGKLEEIMCHVLTTACKKVKGGGKVKEDL